MITSPYLCLGGAAEFSVFVAAGVAAGVAASFDAFFCECCSYCCCCCRPASSTVARQLSCLVLVLQFKSMIYFLLLLRLSPFFVAAGVVRSFKSV